MSRMADVDSYEAANRNEYDLLIKTLTNKANYKIDLIEHGKRVLEEDKTTFVPTNFIIRKWRFDWSRGLSVANISIPMEDAEEFIKLMLDVLNGTKQEVRSYVTANTNPKVKAA
jgi:hypothetical protein